MNRTSVWCNGANLVQSAPFTLTRGGARSAKVVQIAPVALRINLVQIVLHLYRRCTNCTKSCTKFLALKREVIQWQ
jgi:hypothetical protein